ncbi:MFS transporter [Laceyella putida]|uniref:MFS transporter n=1 Tax=Laceyella putida TaxID=110101 RepID=A0ABW2RQ74_9BACL
MRTKLWTKDFILICLANFFLFAGFFVLLSTLPVYAVDELKAQEGQVGLIVGMFTIASVLMRPYGGLLVDQLDRRKIVLWTICLYLLATFSYFAAMSFALLLVIRILHGGMFGIATTALGAVVTDIIPSAKRGEGLGYFGTSNMLAMVVGPAFGLMVIHALSYQWLFFFCGLLVLVSLLLIMLVKFPKDTAQSPRMQPRFTDWAKMIERQAFYYSMPIIGFAMVFGGIVSFISLYAAELGDADMAGGFYFCYALALVIARLFSGRLFDRKGPDYVVYPSVIAYVIGLICMALAEDKGLFYAAGALIGAGYGSIQPCLQALVISRVPAARRGAATATFFIAADLGIGVGSFLLGIIAAWFGYRGMFLFTLLFVASSALLYWTARRTEKDASQPEVTRLSA